MNPEEIPAQTERPKAKPIHWPTTATGMSAVGFAQVGLFVIVAFHVLHQMRPVLLPIVLAVLVSLIVHPVYALFRKFHVPRMLSSALTVSGLLAILSVGAYQAILPAAQWMQNMDEEQVLGRVREVFRPMKEAQQEIKEMANRMEKATNEVTPEEENAVDNPAKEVEEGASEKLKDVVVEVTAPDPKVAKKAAPPADAKEAAEAAAPDAAKPVMVEIHEDPIGTVLDEASDFGLGFVSFLLMVFFNLAYGQRFVRQLYRGGNLEDILSRMGSDVSKYMFTITTINAALGLCITLAMWGMGMPRPILWGVMGMLFNFIPYVGAVTGTLVVFLAAAVNFQQAGMVFAVPAVYFTLTAIEGNLVTPTVLGGRFRINPLVVFVWIFAWAGFWGIAGMLIAMPALVIFKIVCEKTEKMNTLGRMLGD